VRAQGAAGNVLDVGTGLVAYWEQRSAYVYLDEEMRPFTASDRLGVVVEQLRAVSGFQCG